MRKVFYSYHYKKDVSRVQQIRNMGIVEGNTPVLPNKWEEYKREGNITEIKRWIEKSIDICSCVIVLIGAETSTRPWVHYEINYALKKEKGLLGIYIHNLKDINTKKTSIKGDNPLKNFFLAKDLRSQDIIKTFDPSSHNTYNDIQDNLATLIEEAIRNQEKQKELWEQYKVIQKCKIKALEDLTQIDIKHLRKMFGYSY